MMRAFYNLDCLQKIDFLIGKHEYQSRNIIEPHVLSLNWIQLISLELVSLFSTFEIQSFIHHFIDVK